MSAAALRGLLIVAATLSLAAPAQAGLSVLDNGKVRVGIDLGQGGKLTWLSRSNGEHADNLLFEAEQSDNGGPFGPGGGPSWHGYQDPAAVVAHSNDGRTIYDRALWVGCECAMETWITLHGNAVVAQALEVFRRTLDEETAREVQDPDAVRAALLRHFASEREGKAALAAVRPRIDPILDAARAADRVDASTLAVVRGRLEDYATVAGMLGDKEENASFAARLRELR